MRTFHPCPFQFKTTNIRRTGNVVDGGESLSGISDDNETTGGGFLVAEFSNGSTRDKAGGNAWRAVTDLDGGEVLIVMLCAERLFQPVGAFQEVTHSDGTPFDDDTPYVGGGLSFETTADAALRATSLQITGAADLIGGELFSIEHPNWGWRAYRIRAIQSGVISFRPPLREAVPAGTELEFYTPRCQMKMKGSSGNETTIGKYTNCAISFEEDMRKPAA